MFLQVAVKYAQLTLDLSHLAGSLGLTRRYSRNCKGRPGPVAEIHGTWEARCSSCFTKLIPSTLQASAHMHWTTGLHTLFLFFEGLLCFA